MSAFFVSKKTIDDVVSTLRPALMTDDEAGTALGQALWAMNAEALKQRYDIPAEDEEMNQYLADLNAYTFEESKDVEEVQYLKSINCLIYQCSEGNVPERDLFRRIERHAELLTEVLSKGRQSVQFGEMYPFVPGYNEAKWDR